MRAARLGWSGHCWSQGSLSSHTGANCQRAWPRYHKAGAIQMPSQSMNATACPFLKTVLRGAISPWQTMSPSATAWGPLQSQHQEQSPSRCRDTRAAGCPPTPALQHRASTPRPRLAPNPRSTSALLRHQAVNPPPEEHPRSRTSPDARAVASLTPSWEWPGAATRRRPGQTRSPSRRLLLPHRARSPHHKANGAASRAI